MKAKVAALFGFISLLLIQDARADATVTHIESGRRMLVYWQINLGGVVWLSIRSPSGSGCAELYWKTYPLFLTKLLGQVCGNTRIEIPGLGQAAVGAGLYAQAKSGPIKIIGSSQESVAYNFPPVSFP